MTKARLVPALCALVALSVLVAACGGVPGNAVATVNGQAIQKTSFDHWLHIAAKSSGTPNATVPDPPDFTSCIATLKKQAAKNSKTTDAQYKSQCKTQYNQLRDQVLGLLIQYRWIEGQAKAMGIKVTDAQVRKTFEQQKKQAYPKEADYQKFLKNSGQTEADILTRIRLSLLANKIQQKVIKGKNKVSQADVVSYYNTHKSAFSQPERRDLRIVLTKTKAKAEQALQALKSGQSWKTVAKQYSIDQASKNQGGSLPAQAKGTLEKQLDSAVFSAKSGKLSGPVKTQFGWYVFQVQKVTKGTQQSLKQATPVIRQTLQQQNQQNAITAFLKTFERNWRGKTECRDGYKTSDCSNGPKPTPTPSAAGTTPSG